MSPSILNNSAILKNGTFTPPYATKYKYSPSPTGPLSKIEYKEFIIEEILPEDPVMNKIGAFRYRVWLEEGELNVAYFNGEKVWFDEFDAVSRHWMVYPFFKYTFNSFFIFLPFTSIRLLISTLINSN
jgi:hypothetical protein